LTSAFQRELEALDRDQLVAIALKLQRQNIEQKMAFRRELDYAYGLISPIEYLDSHE
jgi:hypothetical protein